MTEYYRYSVEITDEGRRIRIDAIGPDGQKIKEPGGVCTLEEIPDRIDVLAEDVRRKKAKLSDMNELGEALFEALFPAEVTTDFRNLLTEVSSKDAILRLELDLDEAELPNLAALPWEFLRAPQTPGRAVDNLATHPKMVLSRRRRLWQSIAPLELAEPLRVLLVVSAPNELGAVIFEPIEVALKNLHKKSPGQIAAPLATLHQPSITNLKRILKENEPHVVHFIGHGRLKTRSKGEALGQLAFVGAEDTVDWRSAEQIGEIFQTHRPQVVLLHACESAADDPTRAFVGVASQVVQRGVPVVIAMQYPIRNVAAVAFAEEFYRQLGDFEPVDVAVQNGRQLLRDTSPETRDFAAPVLFMRVEDGRLFVPPHPVQPVEPVRKPGFEVAPADTAAAVSDWPTAFVTDLPHPLAVTCAKFNQAKTDIDHFSAVDRLLNNLVKYLTALALSHYWQDKPDKAQLRLWLGTLSESRLKSSLTVFSQIQVHYTAVADRPYLFPVLFEPYNLAVDDESPLAEAYELLRRLRRGRRNQEEITPHTFLSHLLDFRERKWEAQNNAIDESLRNEFLPALRAAMEQLITIYGSLLRYPLRYVHRVDQVGQEWVYTMIEFPGAEGNPILSEDFFREQNVPQPSYAPHRLYLCTTQGRPILNLHPFLIDHLNRLYFLEQAHDRTNIWYQHCASPERYQPPEHYQSHFLSASQTAEDMETADDPVTQLEQANSTLDEDNDKRFAEMPLPILLTHLSVDGRQTLEFALGESLRIGRFWLGAEFLLMGLSRQRSGIFSTLLREIGLQPGELRGALRGMVGVVSERDWRRQNVTELGLEALVQLQVAGPDQLRQTLSAGDDPVPIITPRMLTILKDAAKMAGKDQVGHTHLLLAVCRQPQALAMQLFFSMAYQADWSPEQVITRLAELADTPPEGLIGDNDVPDSPNIRRRPDQTGVSPRPPRRGSVLSQLGRDLTQATADGRLHPAAGEAARLAIAQIGRILLQREANNPILVGDPGVGKTAVVEGFAWRLLDRERPVVSQLAGRRVIELSANALTSGTKYRGDLEERLQKLLAEVKAADGQIIVFIDEIHNILKEGSHQAIADALKPALARGEFPCIGATTVAEYRQYVEKDAALARRFTPIWLEEPTVEEAIEIVGMVAAGHLAAHHQIGFDRQAIEAAVRLSARYLHDERLPGKAIKVLDEAASSLIVPGTLFGGDEAEQVGPGGRSVTVEDVVDIIAERTNIPVTHLGKTDKQRLLDLEGRLQTRIIGQSEAIAQVVRVVKRAGAGLSDPRRPQGVFLFAGPTGVGKTELALALTEALFDSEEAIFRLDMSEFMEKHQVARLTGAPPGYVGYEHEGQLTGRLRRYPYSVILLDEIEKAHPDVQHLFLQLFDNGRLTDSQGRMADGRNAIFIMTTNLGAKEVLDLAAATKSYQDKLLAAIHGHFTMEFINRIDRIVYFNPLDEAALFTIFDRELLPFQKKLERESGITVTVHDEAKYQIVRHIIQQKLGARPLRRFIADKIIAPIVDKLLAGDYKPGTQVTLGSEFAIDSAQPPSVSSPGGQGPFAFDPGQIELSGGGASTAPRPKPKRPTTPEAGLPHLDNVDHADQAVFDERFLALAQRLAEKNIALEIDRLAKYFLCAPGASEQKPRQGRPIEQAFDDLIEQPLTDKLLAEEFKNGDWIKLDYSPDGPVIKKMDGGV